jgi:hypothetical protein
MTDVLEVEREIARVRGEIEQMEAQRKHLTSRIELATIELRIEEERRAGFSPARPSAIGDLRNAAVDGLREAVELTMGLLMLLLRVAPTAVLWGVPVVWLVRVWRRRLAG